MTAPDPADTFRQEARELLEELEQALLDLGQADGDRALIDTCFRALHTLKGSGSMFGFDELAGFVHDFETAFDRVRQGQVEVSPILVSLALSAKDHIARLIAEPGRHTASGEAILGELRGIMLPSAAIGEDAAASSAAPAARRSWRIRFRLPADAFSLGTNPLLLLDELRALGPCVVAALIDAIPALEDLDPETCHLGWDVMLATEHPVMAIEDVFIFLRDGMELSIEEVADSATANERACAGEPTAGQDGAVAGPPASAEVPPSAKRQDAAKIPDGRAGSSLRVPAERLDDLMDRVGELVIAQARLSQIAAASADVNLKSVAEEIERLASGLRDTTMGIRMVPIGTLFGRFRRLVHDLAGDLGKQVEFLTSGEDTELDKTMIERLADPLVHVIRNAVDHGLEDPLRRRIAGKPARGRVRLTAAHTGAEVAISISDDGAGLDRERIRARAEEIGLLAAESRLPDQEIHQLIFHPGFSTAREVTAVSGRGVGMDVVKRTVEALRGSIDVTSRPGEGTAITLKLPLTLAIIEGMLVRVGKGRYSIPLSAVEECVGLPATATGSDGQRNFLNIRDTLVPFLRLRELFKTREPPESHQKVVIVSAGEHRVGLVVDEILGNSQTVIKSLSKLHSDVETFSGATILGDGTVALILDVGHLVRFGQALEERLRGLQVGRAA